MILNEAPILNAIQKVADLQSRLNILVGECMEEHREEITAILVHQQYEEGVDKSGNKLRQYTVTTQHLKTQMGIYTGKTDLHQTGEFQAGITMNVSGEIYTFDSPATTTNGELKSLWLTAWNKATGGDEIMELTAENKRLVWDIIKLTFAGKSANELRG